jgi:proline iminopeptidase
MTTQNTAHDDAGVVDVDGAQLRYRIEGHGPPCLVAGSSVYYPRVFSQHLRERLRLVFADLRHFADPRPPASADPSFRPEQISIDTYTGEIDQVRKALGLGEVVVVGHSIHGTIALEYARRYPQHVRGVVATAGVQCGLAACECEWLLACAAHNLRKLHQHRVQG